MKWLKFVWHIGIRTTYDGTLIRASALTYQTLLAIVPLFAIMLAVAKGFGLQNLLEQTLNQEFRDQKEILQYLITFSVNTLEQLKEGTLAVIGLVALFFTVTRLFASFEEALNSMWGIVERRSFLRMLSAHISLVLAAPLLFAFSSSISIFLTTQLQSQPEDGLIIEYTRTFFGNVLPILPYVTIALLFTLFLYTLPTRRPMWYEALISGALASIAFQVLQGTYIHLQLEMTKMSAVWGSFVALPLFLAWLWASWAILLGGGQLCVAIHEHLWTYSKINDSVDSPVVKISYMVAILEETKSSLDVDNHCLSVEELGRRLQITQRVLNPLLLEMQYNNCVMLSRGEESGSTLVAPLVGATISAITSPKESTIQQLPPKIQPVCRNVALELAQET